MKDYTELLREIRMFVSETKIGYWKVVLLTCLAIVLWRVGDPQVLEITFRALGWLNQP